MNHGGGSPGVIGPPRVPAGVRGPTLNKAKVTNVFRITDTEVAPNIARIDSYPGPDQGYTWYITFLHAYAREAAGILTLEVFVGVDELAPPLVPLDWIFAKGANDPALPPPSLDITPPINHPLIWYPNEELNVNLVPNVAGPDATGIWLQVVETKDQ